MDVKEFIQKTVSEHPVVLFMKGTAQFPQCGFSGRAIQLLKACDVKNVVTVNVLDDDGIRQGIKDFSNCRPFRSCMWAESLSGARTSWVRCTKAES